MLGSEEGVDAKMYLKSLPAERVGECLRIFQESQGQLGFLHPICYKYLSEEYHGRWGEIFELDVKPFSFL